MLKEYLRSAYGVYSIVPLGGIILAGYSLITGSGSPPHVMFVIGIATFLILDSIPILMVTVAYLRKKKRIPSAIRITRTEISVDEQSYPLTDIRKLTVTPPEYKSERFSNQRLLRIETDREKKIFDLGYRHAFGVFKTVFGEYPALCDSLITVAENNNIQFVYDL